VSKINPTAEMSIAGLTESCKIGAMVSDVVMFFYFLTFFETGRLLFSFEITTNKQVVLGKVA
jgi:hypothetical protein